MKRFAMSVIGLLTLLALTPALAADHPQVLPGWNPEPFSDFTLPAGTYCPFALKLDILRNDAIGAITKTYPDGSTQEKVLMGPQLIRVSNVETGKSTVTFLDGIQIIDYATDGSIELTNLGKNMVGFLAGDDFPAGFYFIDGYHLVDYAPGFASRHMASAIGVETNYCETLKGRKHD